MIRFVQNADDSFSGSFRNLTRLMWPISEKTMKKEREKKKNDEKQTTKRQRKQEGKAKNSSRQKTMQQIYNIMGEWSG